MLQQRATNARQDLSAVLSINVRLLGTADPGLYTCVASQPAVPRGCLATFPQAPFTAASVHFGHALRCLPPALQAFGHSAFPGVHAGVWTLL